MSPESFLDALSNTTLGRLALINCYRSIDVGTVPDTSLKAFVADCCVRLLPAFRRLSPPPRPMTFAGQRCVRDWDTRAASSRKNRIPDFSCERASEAASRVIHYRTLAQNARSAVHRTYSARRHCSEDDLNAIITEWQVDGATWALGKDRDFFGERHLSTGVV